MNLLAGKFGTEKILGSTKVSLMLKLGNDSVFLRIDKFIFQGYVLTEVVS